MENLEYWLSHYGYAAILIGTFLEGESILVMGGFAAHEGYLSLPGVLLAAFLGSFGGDQLYFLIGRRQGRKLLARHPKWQARVNRVYTLLARYQTVFILGFRFLYGLRTITPFVLGTTDLKTRRYFILNMIGAIVWAIGIGGAGYLFGEVVQRYIGRAKQYEGKIFLAIAVVGTVLVALGHLRQRRRCKAEAEALAAATPAVPGDLAAPAVLAAPEALEASTRASRF